MEGQGVAASAASEAGRNGEPGVGAVVAAGFDDPGVGHVTSDDSGGGEGQRHDGDDITLVMPALGRPEASEPSPGTSPAGSADAPSGPAEPSQPPQPSTGWPSAARLPEPPASPEPQPHAGERQSQNLQSPASWPSSVSWSSVASFSDKPKEASLAFSARSHSV